MFSDQPEEILHQGDICTVDCFPKWTLDAKRFEVPGNDYKYVSSHHQNKKHIVQSDTGFLVCVCSYECELDKNTRSGILLAPVRPVETRSNDPDEIKRLMGSWKPQDDDTYLNYHLFPLQIELDGQTMNVAADFSSITSLSPPKEAVKHLVKTKKYELTEEFRSHFQIKLSLFMFRPGDA